MRLLDVPGPGERLGVNLPAGEARAPPLRPAAAPDNDGGRASTSCTLRHVLTIRGASRRVARFALAGVLAGFGFGPAARAEVYYTRDSSGAMHFSNVPTKEARVFLATPREAPASAIADPVVTGRAFGKAVSAGAYDDLIAQSAARYAIEPALVKAVIRAESAFHPRAVSWKGARGLMQLMPATARDLGCRNVFDPEDNIDAGAKHLRSLIDQYGWNLPHVLAAYNAGEASVDRYHGIPPYAETRAYVAQVLRYRREYLTPTRVSPARRSVRQITWRR